MFLANKTSFCKGDEGETDEESTEEATLGDVAFPVVGCEATGVVVVVKAALGAKLTLVGLGRRFLGTGNLLKFCDL